jgi:hypothetical protein
MAYNFLHGDRDQPFLLPLTRGTGSRRITSPGSFSRWSTSSTSTCSCAPIGLTGTATPAYDPKTLLGVLLYGYAIGVRSSRQLQRRCIEDLALRVLAGNQTPDM